MQFLVAASMIPALVWIGTACNPADGPSRAKVDGLDAPSAAPPWIARPLEDFLRSRRGMEVFGGEGQLIDKMAYLLIKDCLHTKK